MEIEQKFNLTETTKEEALSIINFLIGFWEIKQDELDFEL